MPTGNRTLLGLSEAFSILAKAPSSGEITIVPTGPSSARVLVSVHPVDVNRVDTRRLATLGWEPSPGGETFERLYETPPE